MGILISALLPLALPLVKRLIHGAEDAFGPKTGPVKKEAVLKALTAFMESFLTSGKITAAPSQELLEAILEIVLNQEKGNLPQAAEKTNQHDLTPVNLTPHDVPPLIQVRVGQIFQIEGIK